MLLDSPALWYRAFHGVPDSVRSPRGEPVNAVRGFVDLVARVVKEHRPARLVATVDLDWRPAFRVAAVPSYKRHRTVEGGAEDGFEGVTGRLWNGPSLWDDADSNGPYPDVIS